MAMTIKPRLPSAQMIRWMNAARRVAATDLAIGGRVPISIVTHMAKRDLQLQAPTTALQSQRMKRAHRHRTHRLQ
jgi:hypothetical protein